MTGWNQSDFFEEYTPVDPPQTTDDCVTVKRWDQQFEPVRHVGRP